MRKAILATTLFLGLGALAPQPANAIGCLSGGAAGALAGHMAGHGILGALGGCVAGHAWHKHTLRKQDLANQQSYETRQRSWNNHYSSPWGSSSQSYRSY